jgi:hypothetical protein
VDADLAQLLAEMETRIREELLQELRNQVQVTTATRSTSLGDKDGSSGWPDTEKPYQRPSRRMQHFGFRSVPPKNAAKVMLLVGGGNASEVTVAEGSDGFGPGDLGDGAASLFSSGDARVVADGADVVVNEGTAKVGRLGDATGSGSLVAVATQVGPTATVVFTFVPQGGGAPVAWFTLACTGTVTPGTYTLPLPGKITAGADHFKA